MKIQLDLPYTVLVKLRELCAVEGCTVEQLVSQITREYLLDLDSDPGEWE